jgi:hypothetical protein
MTRPQYHENVHPPSLQSQPSKNSDPASLQLASIDKLEVTVDEESSKGSPNENHTSAQPSQRSGIHSDSSHWKDSGHSTLVVDTSDSTKAMQLQPQ